MGPLRRLPRCPGKNNGDAAVPGLTGRTLRGNMTGIPGFHAYACIAVDLGIGCVLVS